MAGPAVTMCLTSEWIHVGGFPSDRNPLPLGEFLPIGGTADAGSVAGRTHAPERIDHVVVDGLIVDVQQSGAKPIANAQGSAHRTRDDASRQAILGLIGECDRPLRPSRSA